MTSQDNARTTESDGTLSAQSEQANRRTVFKAPAEAAQVAEPRRTWEAYANDFRDLTLRFSALQSQHEEKSAEASALQARYESIQAQRRSDQHRLALIERARSTMEANRADQARRTRAAENALAQSRSEIVEREKAIQAAQVERDAALAEKGDIERQVHDTTAQMDHLRASYLQADDMIGHLRLSHRLLEARHASLLERAATLPARDHIAQTPAHVTDAAPATLQALDALRAQEYPAPSSMMARLASSLALKLARRASRQGFWAQAEILYNVVLLVRDSAALWVQLGHVMREQGRFLNAAAAYDQAVRRNPNSAENHVLLGLAYAGNGQAAAAESSYRDALRIDPGLRSVFGELRNVQV